MINTATKADLENLVLKQDANLVELSLDGEKAFKKSLHISIQEPLKVYLSDGRGNRTYNTEPEYKTYLETMQKLRILDLPKWKELMRFDDLFFSIVDDIKIRVSLIDSYIRVDADGSRSDKFSQRDLSSLYTNLRDAFKPYSLVKAAPKAAKGV